jgi:REP element-mobilizing transposase RayT
MAQTLTLLLTHIIFSTKDRAPLIKPELEPELFAYIGKTCKNADCRLLAAGGTEDHVHLLVSMSKNLTLPSLMLPLKRDSSRWMREHGVARFRWQNGYAGLSIGKSQEPDLRRYLARQKTKHARVTFKQELVTLLEKCEIEYDERYLWD